MSELYPQVVDVVIKSIEGLPSGTRPYIAIDVVGKKAAEACPPPTTRVLRSAAVGPTEVNEAHAILLRSGDTVSVILTIWDKGAHCCDAILGRSVSAFDRLNPPGSTTLYLHGGRTLHVDISVRTVSLLVIKNRTPLYHSSANDTTSSTTATTTSLSHSTTPSREAREVLVVDSGSRALQLLSRSVVSWLASKLREARRIVQVQRGSLEYREAEGRAARHRIETLEGVIAVQKELQTQREERFAEQSGELENEVHAAIQALEASEAENEEARGANAVLTRQYNQLRHTVDKLRHDLEMEKSNNKEGAAVEALLGGGCGDVVRDLDVRVRTLTAENQHLSLKLHSYSLMEGLVERFLPKLYKTLDLPYSTRGSASQPLESCKAAWVKAGEAEFANAHTKRAPHPPQHISRPAAAIAARKGETGKEGGARRRSVPNPSLQFVTTVRHNMADAWY